MNLYQYLKRSHNTILLNPNIYKNELVEEFVNFKQLKRNLNRCMHFRCNLDVQFLESIYLRVSDSSSSLPFRLFRAYDFYLDRLSPDESFELRGI